MLIPHSIFVKIRITHTHTQWLYIVHTTPKWKLYLLNQKGLRMPLGLMELEKVHSSKRKKRNFHSQVLSLCIVLVILFLSWVYAEKKTSSTLHYFSIMQLVQRFSAGRKLGIHNMMFPFKTLKSKTRFFWTLHGCMVKVSWTNRLDYVLVNLNSAFMEISKPLHWPGIFHIIKWYTDTDSEFF